MRILMLNYEYPPLGGGASNANYYMFREFSKWGKEKITIDLVTSAVGEEFKSQRVGDNIRIFRLPVGKKQMQYWTMGEIAKWTWKARGFSKDLMRKYKYDLVHCWFGWPGGLIGYMLRKKLPYLVALRGSDVPGFNPRLKNLDPILFKPLSKRIWKNARFVVPNSVGLKKLAQGTWKGKFTVIYNGIDTEEFRPPKKGNSGSKIKLISVGRLIPRKGYPYLSDAMKGQKNLELTLVGEGSVSDDLEAQAKKNKVKLKLAGAVDHEDLPALLQKADIFVLPSLNEGMSNAALEAMACGLPVILTDVGGSKELVKGNGFLVKKGSAKELKKALSKYDRALIEKQGKRSRELAQKMSWDSICQQYYKLYEKSV